MSTQKDISIVREFAKKYSDIANLPEQAEKRNRWAAHFSLKKTQPLILASFGMWNVWCGEFFGDSAMTCEDPILRQYERTFKMLLFRHDVGDDFIFEPWFTMQATTKGEWGQLWGVKEDRHDSGVDGGAWQFDPPIKDWRDLDRLKMVHHEIDEEKTQQSLTFIQDAMGDIIPINVDRSPCYHGFMSDISTCLARLRGLEQVMLDMYESPDELHRLLAFMRDSILTNNQEAEDAGDYSLTSAANQAMPYAEELEFIKPNSGSRLRQDLWGFCAAQEFTLISPDFHNEFLLQYQKPIYDHYGLLHYGCCEDLGEKIDMLRQLKNLRSIAVTPVADIHKCADQIGRDYAISWRPNPTDMVCCGYDEDRIKRIINDGLEACNDKFFHIHLKDVETLEGDLSRMKNWVSLVRNLTENG